MEYKFSVLSLHIFAVISNWRVKGMLQNLYDKKNSPKSMQILMKITNVAYRRTQLL